MATKGSVAIDMLQDQYLASNRNELIQKLLDRFRNKSIREQLNQQRIKQVLIRPLKGDVAWLIPLMGGFKIFLAERREGMEWLEDIGHELAHTFFFNLSQDFPRKITGHDDPEEESFCDDFAIRWVELNKSKFKPILEKWRREKGGVKGE